jgi:hypothetical protein
MPLVRFMLKHALLVYVIAALLVVVFMGLATGVIHQYELVEKGAQAQGVVIKPDCGRHLSFSYRFRVAEATYPGQSVSDHCGSVRAGTAVTVHYLPADPSVNTAEDPGELFRGNRDTILLAALTAPAFLLLSFRVRLKIWERGGNGSSHW